MKFENLKEDLNQNHIFSYSKRPDTDRSTNQIILDYIRKFNGIELRDIFFKILRARGFLIDKDKANWWVSDNSYLNKDIYFLHQLLKKVNIGCLHGNHIVITNPNNITRDSFFNFFRYSPSSSFITYFNSNNFCDGQCFNERIHGIKIPVERLDPFISYLVKALSAAGIYTLASCDGHGSKNPYIFFKSKYDAALFSSFLKIYYLDKNLLKNWAIKFIIDLSGQHCLLSINPTTNNNYADTYYEIYRVAKVFYKNRIKMREQKRMMVENLKKSEVFPRDVSELNYLFLSELKSINNR